LWRDRVALFLRPGEWQDAFKQRLAGAKRADVTVVASNRLVRYAVVPRTKDVNGEDEELALARHHFSRLHGERVREWHVRLDSRTGLASAVDLALIGSLKTFFAERKGLRLVSFQPCLMAAFNASRDRVPKEGAWIVLPEAEATCIALFERGLWAGVSVTRNQVPAEALLERERLRMGTPRSPRTVLKLTERDLSAAA
jgi:hypothetical protein